MAANKLAEAFVEIGVRDNTPTALQRVRQNVQNAADNSKFQIHLEGLKNVADAERDLAGLNNALKTVWSQLDALANQKTDVLRNMGFDEKTASKFGPGKGMPSFFGKMPQQEAQALQFIDAQYANLARLHRQYEDQRVMVSKRSAALRMQDEQRAAEFAEQQMFEMFMAEDQMAGRQRANRTMGIGGRVGGGGRGLNAFLEVSRGIEDFAAVAPTMGISGGLRAASNNISQMAFQIHPLAGAIAGLSIAAVALAPSLYKMATATKDPIDEFKRLEKSLRGVEDAAKARFEFKESVRDVSRIKTAGESGEKIEGSEKSIREMEFERLRKVTSLTEFGSRTSRVPVAKGRFGEALGKKITEDDAKKIESTKLEVSSLSRRIESEQALIDVMKKRIPVLEEIARKEGMRAKAEGGAFRFGLQRKEEQDMSRDMSRDIKSRTQTMPTDKIGLESFQRMRPQIAAIMAGMQHEMRVEQRNVIGDEARRNVRINAMKHANRQLSELDKTEAVERQVQESQRAQRLHQRSRVEKQTAMLGDVFGAISPRMQQQAQILADAAEQKSRVRDIFPANEAKAISSLIDKTTVVKLRDAGKPESKFSGISDFGRTFQEAVSSKENRSMINIDQNTRQSVESLKGIHSTLTKYLENTSSGFGD